eukprot:Rmarinus@m.10963
MGLSGPSEAKLTAIENAIKSGNLKTLQKAVHSVGGMFKKSSCDLNAYLLRGESSSIFHVACESGHLNCIQWLLEEGASDVLPNKQGRSPADLCAKFHRTAALKLLMARMVDSGLGEEENAERVLYTLLRIVEFGNSHASMLQCALECLPVTSRTCVLNREFGSFDGPDRVQETLIHRAARQDAASIVDVLASNECDLNALSRRIQTHKHMTSVILRTPVMIAVETCHNKTLSSLLHNGADANLCLSSSTNVDTGDRTCVQETALHLAVEAENLDAVQILLRAEASPNIPWTQHTYKNNSSLVHVRSVLDLCVEQQSESLVRTVLCEARTAVDVEAPSHRCEATGDVDFTTLSQSSEAFTGTPLFFSVLAEQHSLAAVLVSHGAKPRARCRWVDEENAEIPASTPLALARQIDGLDEGGDKSDNGAGSADSEEQVPTGGELTDILLGRSVAYGSRNDCDSDSEDGANSFLGNRVSQICVVSHSGYQAAQGTAQDLGQSQTGRAAFVCKSSVSAAAECRGSGNGDREELGVFTFAAEPAGLVDV